MLGLVLLIAVVSFGIGYVVGVRRLLEMEAVDALRSETEETISKSGMIFRLKEMGVKGIFHWFLHRSKTWSVMKCRICFAVILSLFFLVNNILLSLMDYLPDRMEEYWEAKSMHIGSAYIDVDSERAEEDFQNQMIFTQKDGISEWCNEYGREHAAMCIVLIIITLMKMDWGHLNT